MSRSKTFETTVVRVSKKKDRYLKTPIPTAIKELFKIDHGSKLTWKYTCKDGPRIEIIPSTGTHGAGGD